MAASRYDLTVDQGAVLDTQFRYLNPDGSPVDLTGYSARCQIRSAAGPSGKLLLTLDSESTPPTITIDGPNGLITLNASADMTAGILSKSGTWDLFIWDTPDNARMLLFGNVIIRQRTTV